MRKRNEIFREFVKEKEDTMDLINLKVREVLKCLDNIENNEECNKAKLILFQCLILTKLTLMSEEEVAHVRNI